MGFLKRDDGESEDRRKAELQQAAATEEAPHAATYEPGSLAGIPESGLERIARMKQEVARGFFTSDLSVNEFLLVKQSGLRATRAGARAARSTTSAFSRRCGTRARRWAFSPRRCTTRASWR